MSFDVDEKVEIESDQPFWLIHCTRTRSFKWKSGRPHIHVFDLLDSIIPIVKRDKSLHRNHKMIEKYGPTVVVYVCVWV